jgi:cytoskeletal protein RodZ
VVLPDNLRWTGEQLRKAREARGLTVVQLAEKTRITRHHIENVEADRFEKLPAPVYLRGIVMCLARELRLDGQKVARSYLEHQAATPGKAP